MFTRLTTASLLALLLILPALAQEPPTPPETPPGHQEWWPSQARPLPFVHPLFSDDMVLQRDIADPVWGWSTPGDSILVTVANPAGGDLGKGAQASAVAGADGKWMTKVGPFAAGGPLTLTVKGAHKQVTLTNVLVGDVWLCSGQSNMSIPVRTALNAAEEIKNANYPEIRSFTVGFYPSYVPMRVPLPAVWETCTPAHVPNFSAVGYYFAREINKTQKIPVGIIHSSVGATTAEVWISAAGLRKYMPYDFHEQLGNLAKWAGDAGADYDYFKDVEKWAAAADPKSAAMHYASDPALNTDDWKDVAVPKAWKDAGLGDFAGLVWLRTSVDVPADWAGKPATLMLSSINDLDITWVNGTLVGSTQVKGGNHTYQIDGDLIKAGKNLLTVAVLNAGEPGGFTGDPRNMVLRTTADVKAPALNLAGTWKAKAAVAGKDIAAPFPRPKVGYYKTLTGMFNGMIGPLEPFAIKGAVWYQGEASWPFWLQYRRLLPAIIADWRDGFQVGDFPFLIVSVSTQSEKQSHPVEPGYAEVREAQWRTARTVPNTGLVITADIGDEPVSNIHPKNKQEVGRRLGLLARHLVYGEKDLLYSGPEYTEMMLELMKPAPQVASDAATQASTQPAPKHYQTRLYFKHLGGGLVFKPADVKRTGFVVAGEDKKFVWADAVIEGDTVVVSSPEVSVPRYVRYGWAYNPIITLFNKEGLPAVPFRTDE